MDTPYDVIIVGGGPAGLTAALYLARANDRVLVLEREQFGGQIAITEDVVNYPGLMHVTGQSLAETMKHQAASFGADFMIAEATGFSWEQDIKIVQTNKGSFRSLGILLAIGAKPRSAGFIGEEQYRGRGVTYCATCDGAFFEGKDVFVIGGGYVSAEESVFLTKFARHVTILIRKDDFSCAPSLADKARNHEKITVLTNTVMEEVAGKNGINYVRYCNIKTGERTEYHSQDGETCGVFVFAGYAPDTEFLRDVISLDDRGYILTDQTMKTSAEGVYAAGDVCVKPLRQIVTATSDGALAATELEKYVSFIQKKIGLVIDKTNEKTITRANQYFSSDVFSQLSELLKSMDNPIILELFLDDRPISKDLEEFTKGFVELTNKLSMKVNKTASDDFAPCIRLCREDEIWTGLSFYGVPSGHELLSFALGVYNASGLGQRLDDHICKRIDEIQTTVNIKVLITLSCTMCPDTVIGAQKIAAMNPHVTAEIYDILHYRELREQYHVMSVPCLIINDDIVSFGKKNIDEILDLILRS